MQAALYIAAQEKRRVGIKEISQELNIPMHFLAKILQALSEAGLLVSYKGVHGGFTLGKEPTEIRLLDIVEAIDGLDIFSRCILGFPNCGTSRPCPMHDKWGNIRTIIYEMLAAESLADLMIATRKKVADLKKPMHHS